MQVYEWTDYKRILREKARELARQRRTLTLKRIAERVPMQYTYLSRALNRDDTHLSEDQLHSICQQLEFFADEIDYIFTLRSLAVSGNPNRQEYLRSRAERLRRSRELQAPAESPSRSVGANETKFLLSPMAWIVYFSLGVAELRENPRKIARALGLSETKLIEILRDLAEQSLIETSGSAWKVTRVLKNHFHYGPDHPLTRIHQQLLKDLASQHLLKVPESERMGFMATFNADPTAFEAIQKKFREFIRDVEKIAIRAPSRKTYQLAFDLFPWN